VSGEAFRRGFPGGSLKEFMKDIMKHLLKNLMKDFSPALGAAITCFHEKRLIEAPRAWCGNCLPSTEDQNPAALPRVIPSIFRGLWRILLARQEEILKCLALRRPALAREAGQRA